MIQSAFERDGDLLPFAELPEALRAQLGKFAAGGMPRNAIRKALYSSMVAAGAGQESLALVFEHGSNALLPIGPLSFYPLSWIYSTAGEYLESVQERAGVPNLLDELFDVCRQYEPFPVVESRHAGEEDIPEFSDLPGIALFSIPTHREIALIEAAVEEFVRLVRSNVVLSEDFLRSGLLLLLGNAGVPARNLIRHRLYCKIGSFAGMAGMLHFIAVMPQADLGLGLIPVKMEGHSDVTKAILTRLKATGRLGLFDGRTLSRREIGGHITSLLRNKGFAVKGGACEILTRAWVRVSNFRALFSLGGMLAAGLASRLVLPPNYYDIGDLLNAGNEKWKPLEAFDGSPWRNPHIPSERRLEDHLSGPEMVKFLAQKHLAGRGGTGRGRKMGTLFTNDPCEWSDAHLAKWFARYDCWPSRGKITSILSECFAASDSDAVLRAARIFRILREGGRLHAGRPLRFVPSELIPRFLSDELLPTIRASHPGHPEVALKMEGRIWAGAALAMRLGEALRVRADDYHCEGRFETMHIRGTKSWRAARDFPLYLARQGLHGDMLVSGFLRVTREQSIRHDELLFSYQDESAKRASEKLAVVMDRSFQAFRGILRDSLVGDPRIDGRFTHHSLRHAAAIRMLQGVLEREFVSGDLWGAVSELALSMGQSLHTHLCSYLGTAGLLLKKPR